MGRFDHLATRPARGPKDMLRWKVVDALAGRNARDPGGFVTPWRSADRALLAAPTPQLTWIGHASFLLTLAGKRILIDPILGPRVGPVARLAPPGVALDDLPPIDLVLLTHNHRDHLDAWSLSRVIARSAGGEAPHFVAPLGHEGVLRKLGATRVTELDWWQSTRAGELEVTLVPARHWSMIWPWDRNDMLWGGYVIKSPEGTAYHSGDTALFDGFAEIGRRAGPIDWAMLPIGAYEPRWFMEPQHMNPEDTVKAFEMLDARRLVAMHWGTFKLTDEPIGEPPVRTREAFSSAGGDRESLWILDVGETRNLTR